MVIFGIDLPLSPYAIFFTKFCLGEGVHGVVPNFTIVAFKMWPYGPKNRQKW